MKNDINELNRIYTELEIISNKHDFSDELFNELCLCMDEVFSNIIKFAWDDDKEHNVEILFDYKFDAKKFIITLVDDGRPFNPMEAGDPDLSSNLLEREIGGLGIFIVSNIMNNIEYSRKNKKNRLQLTKEI